MLRDFHARPYTIFIVVIITPMTVITIAATPRTSTAVQTLQQKKWHEAKNIQKPFVS